MIPENYIYSSDYITYTMYSLHLTTEFCSACHRAICGLISTLMRGVERRAGEIRIYSGMRPALKGQVKTFVKQVKYQRLAIINCLNINEAIFENTND